MNPLTAWFRKKPVTKAVWITALVAIIALFVNTWVIFQNSKSIKAAQDMVTLMKQANEFNFRPFVQIEGVQPDKIASIANKYDRNQQTFQIPSFILGESSKGEEYIIYSLRNLGHVPAHKINSKVEVFTIDYSDKVKQVPINNETLTNSETLFQGQTNTKVKRLGKGVVLRSDSSIKRVRIKLKITYSGILEDPQIYYHYVIFAIKTAPNLDAFNRLGIDQMITEESEEGVENKS